MTRHRQHNLQRLAAPGHGILASGATAMVAGAIPGRRTAWAILVAHGGYRGRDYQAEVAEQVVEVLRVVWGWETDAEPVSAQAVPAPTTTKTLDYTYDNLNRLVGVSLNQTPTETYVLDPTGNLTSLTVAGITMNFTYNGPDLDGQPGTHLRVGRRGPGNLWVGSQKRTGG